MVAVRNKVIEAYQSIMSIANLMALVRKPEDDGMTGRRVLDVARDALVTLVLVASPLMLIGLVVGVAISLLQALTQIQEMTLVFVPKILAIFAAMLYRAAVHGRLAAKPHAQDRGAHWRRMTAVLRLSSPLRESGKSASLASRVRVQTLPRFRSHRREAAENPHRALPPWRMLGIGVLGVTNGGRKAPPMPRRFKGRLE